MPRGDRSERLRRARALRCAVLALSWNMRALLGRFFYALALVALGTLGACGSAAMSSETGGDDGGGSSATGGSGGTAVALSFNEAKPLLLELSERYPLRLTTTPPAPAETVRFALLDGAGDGADAVADATLDRTEAVTDANGTAEVWLTAPSIPTAFDLSAVLGSAQEIQPVAVRADGKAVLVVEPSYSGGRPVAEWVAEVFDDGRTCADLEGNPPVGDDPARTVTAREGEPIVVDRVPVGTELAVTLRAGHFAGGCSGVESVVEGQPNSVLVTVTNRPIQLDQSAVTVRLGLVDQEDALSDGMASVVERATDALLGTAANDTEALLDAMQEEATAGAVCTGNRFGNARSANAWDEELSAALGAAADASIREDVRGWLVAGVPLLAREDAFVGSLSAVPDMTGLAELALESVAGFAARDAGFPRRLPTTWTADAHDNVVLGASIEFNPAALLVLAAEGPATSAEPRAASIAEALALRDGRCDTVTATLTSNGQGVDQSCLPCGIACTQGLCERAMGRLVLRASEALAGDLAELRIAATGVAEVGDEAELEALSGSWVGALDAADRASELRGDVEASGDY
jgi:hypothetical protein